MAVIVLSLALPGLTEGLAGRRAGPDGQALGHAGEAQRVGPAADPGEEMALREAAQVGGLHLEDGASVHLARGQQPGRDQIPQPGAGRGIGVVVVDGHQAAASAVLPSRAAFTCAKVRPSPSRIASRPVSACQRSTATST